MSYQAPVKDMLFNIQHLAGLQTLTEQIPAFADFGLDTAAAVLEECAKLTQDVIAPLNFEGDKNPSSWKDGVVTTTPGFKQAFRAYAEGGWQGLGAPDRVRRPGRAQDHRGGLQRDAAGRQHELCPLPAADRRRRRGAADRRHRRAEVRLHPQAAGTARGPAR